MPRAVGILSGKPSLSDKCFDFNTQHIWTMENLRHDLRQILADDKILDNELWREIYARDASYFKILPQAVVRPGLWPKCRRFSRWHTEEDSA